MGQTNQDNRIIIFDTTLRDGEQSPGASMNKAEKLRIATQLEKLGVDVIEAGFPAASDDDFLAVKTIAETLKDTQVAALCRTAESDINKRGLLSNILYLMLLKKLYGQLLNRILTKETPYISHTVFQ